MSTIFFVPFGSRPSIQDYWLKHHLNALNEMGQVISNDMEGEHGTKIRDVLELVDDEDTLVLLEEDAFILDYSVIDRHVGHIDEGRYDLIGSPRMSCSPKLAEACSSMWGLDYTGPGDKGPNFWPCFFFIKAKHLKATDGHFTPKGWEKGEYIKELDWEVTEDVAGDTFVWASIQLRAMGLNILEVPQHHSSPYDLVDYEVGAGIFHKGVPWFHIGSLSGDFYQPKTQMERLELEKRAMWLDICGVRVNGIIDTYQLSRQRIDAWKNAYLERLTS